MARRTTLLASKSKAGRVFSVDGHVQRATVKLSVNVSEDVGTKLRHVAFEQRLSESSIVEVALALLFRRSDGQSLGSLLRQQGATLRRRRKSG